MVNGKGMAYFLPESLNELIYKEELQIHYNEYEHQIPANKEYRYILENNNIVKYFIAPENIVKSVGFNYKEQGAKPITNRRATSDILSEFKSFDYNLFYRLDFIDNSRATGSHLCGEDQYNATYIFLNPDSFTLNYQVLGPQKDYNINTVFNRI